MKVLILALFAVLGVAGVGGVIVHTTAPATPTPAPVTKPAVAAEVIHAGPEEPEGFLTIIGPDLRFHSSAWSPMAMRTDTHTVSVTRQGYTVWLQPEALEFLEPEMDPPSKPIEFYTSIEIHNDIATTYRFDRIRTEACSVKVMRSGQALYVTPALAAVLLPEPGNDGTVVADAVMTTSSIESMRGATVEVRPDHVLDYDPRWGDDKANRPLVWRTGTEPELEKKLVDYRGPGKVLENGDVLFGRDDTAAAAAKNERVRRAPVIPDDIGLGERLVLIDVLVEHFGKRRVDVVKWSMDDLVACYWAEVKLTKKPAPFPERAE